MCLLACVLLLATMAAAQTGPPPPRQGAGIGIWQSGPTHESAEVLQEFITFELYAARLDPERWRSMRKLTNVKPRAEWKSFYVAKEHKLGKQRVDNDKGIVTTDVRFKLLGRFENGVGYTAGKSDRTVQYTQEWLPPRVGEYGKWLVTGFAPDDPILGAEGALDVLRKQLAAATDPEWRKKIEQAIAEIQPHL